MKTNRQNGQIELVTHTGETIMVFDSEREAKYAGKILVEAAEQKVTEQKTKPNTPTTEEPEAKGVKPRDVDRGKLKTILTAYLRKNPGSTISQILENVFEITGVEPHNTHYQAVYKALLDGDMFEGERDGQKKVYSLK